MKAASGKTGLLQPKAGDTPVPLTWNNLADAGMRTMPGGYWDAWMEQVTKGLAYAQEKGWLSAESVRNIHEYKALGSLAAAGATAGAVAVGTKKLWDAWARSKQRQNFIDSLELEEVEVTLENFEEALKARIAKIEEGLAREMTAREGTAPEAKLRLLAAPMMASEAIEQGKLLLTIFSILTSENFNASELTSYANALKTMNSILITGYVAFVNNLNIGDKPLKAYAHYFPTKATTFAGAAAALARASQAEEERAGYTDFYTDEDSHSTSGAEDSEDEGEEETPTHSPSVGASSTKSSAHVPASTVVSASKAASASKTPEVKKKGLSGKAIGGIVAGVVLLLGGGAAFLYFKMK